MGEKETKMPFGPLPPYTEIGGFPMGFATETETREGGIAQLVIWVTTKDEAVQLIKDAESGDYPFPLGLRHNGESFTPVSDRERRFRALFPAPLISLIGYKNPPVA